MSAFFLSLLCCCPKSCRHPSTHTANNPTFSHAQTHMPDHAHTRKIITIHFIWTVSPLGLQFQPNDPMNCRLPEPDSLSVWRQIIFLLLRMPLGLCIFSQKKTVSICMKMLIFYRFLIWISFKEDWWIHRASCIPHLEVDSSQVENSW